MMDCKGSELSVTIAKKLTGKDRDVLCEIKRCGFVSVDPDGKPALEVSFDVTAYRLKRLIDLGLLEPSGDTLLPDCPSQTFRPTGRATDVE